MEIINVLGFLVMTCGTIMASEDKLRNLLGLIFVVMGTALFVMK